PSMSSAQHDNPETGIGGPPTERCCQMRNKTCVAGASPELTRVLESAVCFQEIVPDAVLVGNAARVSPRLVRPRPSSREPHRALRSGARVDQGPATFRYDLASAK